MPWDFIIVCSWAGAGQGKDVAGPVRKIRFQGGYLLSGKLALKPVLVKHGSVILKHGFSRILF